MMGQVQNAWPSQPQIGQVPIRVACLEADDSDKWRGLTLQYFRDSFSLHPDDTITFFDCAGKAEFPSIEDVQEGRYDVIFIGGSHFSAYEDVSWIARLRDELLPAYYASKKAKLVGLCFGHQILALALGGRVGKNPSGRFVLKCEDIDFNAKALKESCGLDLDLIVKNQAPSAHHIKLKLIESHGDQVLSLPSDSVLLASSSTAECEMFTIPHRALACQFHPEFPGTDVVIEKIHSALTSKGRLSPEESAASKDSLERSRVDSHPIRLLFRAFMEAPLI